MKNALQKYLLKYMLPLVALLFCVSMASGQNKKADKLMDEFRFAEAAKIYRNVVKKNDTAQRAIEKLAFCYAQLREYRLAELYYSKVVSFENFDPAYHISYGQTLKQNNKIGQARDQFSMYVSKVPSSFIGKLLVQSCDDIAIWREEAPEYEVLNLGDFNTPLAEFSPVVYNEGLIFTSEKGQDHIDGNSFEWTGTPYLSVFYSSFEDSNQLELEKSRPFLKKLNTDFHDGPVCIDYTENKVYFSRVGRSERGKDFINRIKMYHGTISGNKLKDVEPFFLNNDSFSVAHPAISADGQALVFASDMRGGIGGMDLYVCVKIDGEWSLPQNMGRGINTPDNEVFPCFNGDVLYFSSNGLSGFGGLDIFRSEKDGGTWINAENMKDPINSVRDDFSITWYNDTLGYFASNREGGKGSDDIYAFRKIDPQSLEDTNYVDIEGVMEFDQAPAKAINITLVDEEGNTIQTAVTDSNGYFKFTRLPRDQNFLVRIDEVDSDIPADAKVFLIDKEGEKLMLANRIQKGVFEFKALPPDEIAELAKLEEEDTHFSIYKVFGQIFKTLPGDYNDSLEILVINDDGEIISTINTDDRGNFVVDGITKDDPVIFKVSTDDPDLQGTVFYQQDEVVKDTARVENGFLAFNKLDPESKLKKFIPVTKDLLTITGIFENQDQPGSNYKVALINDKQDTVQTGKSDGTGFILFPNLKKDKGYKVKVLETPKSEDLNPSLFFLTDDDGEKLFAADKLDSNTFILTALPLKDLQRISAQKQEEDSLEYSKKVAGLIFGNDGQAQEGVPVYAVNDEGEIVAVTHTDKKGNFEFKKLPSDQHVLFKVGETDMAANMSFVDDAGLLKGGTKTVSGLVYNNEPGDFHKKAPVYAVDKDGEVISLAYTDSTGHFSFKKLPEDDSFLFILGEEDKSASILFDGEIFIADSIKNTQQISGQVFGNELDDAQTEIPVYAVNENGEIVALAYTNAQGQFDFKKLPSDETFLFTLGERDHSSSIIIDDRDKEAKVTKQVTGQIFNEEPGDNEESIPVYAVNEHGEIIAMTYTDKKGKFDFKRLPADETVMFRLGEKDNGSNLIIGEADQISKAKTQEVAGQIYNEQPGDVDEGVPVYAVNENGEIIAMTYTDTRGQFDFKKLPADESFLFMLGEKDNAAKIFVMEEPEEKADTSNTVVGQVYNDTPGDYEEGIPVYAVNENGEIIDMAYTKGDGTFEFKSLPRDESFLFMLGEKDEAAQLVIKGENGELVNATLKRPKGEFNYESVEPDQNLPLISLEEDSATIQERTIPEMEEEKLLVVSSDQDSVIYLIYYGFDQWDISEKAEKELNKLVDMLDDQPGLMLEVSSHTDSRGYAGYNLVLSERRTIATVQYLISKGIPSERIIGYWYGEEKPINFCGNGQWCPNEMHAKNRRTEFKIYKNDTND